MEIVASAGNGGQLLLGGWPSTPFAHNRISLRGENHCIFERPKHVGHGVACGVFWLGTMGGDEKELAPQSKRDDEDIAL
jgi:hypothetical protein